MPKYRARGHYIPTDRDSWVTTVWRNTEQEAINDLKYYADGNRYLKRWIVKKKE